MRASVREFVRLVRDGEAPPEAVEAALRSCLDDPSLKILLTIPGECDYFDLEGRQHHVQHTGEAIPLIARDALIGLLVLGRVSTRRLRLAGEMAVEARLPIEVSRLRLELHRALEDVSASRTRLVEEVIAERRRLERDLHDGAQQRILAVGMRLRSVQRERQLDLETHEELDAAIEALQATIDELRELAQGLRPSRLNDGLEAAIRDLTRGSPIPVEVERGEGNGSGRCRHHGLLRRRRRPCRTR